MTVSMVQRAWAGLRTSHHCFCPGESQSNCRRLLSPNLLPLTLPSPSVQARRAPRCRVVFLGQGRRSEKQIKVNAGAQRGRRDHAGSQFLSVGSGPGRNMHTGHTVLKKGVQKG